MNKIYSKLVTKNVVDGLKAYIRIQVITGNFNIKILELTLTPKVAAKYLPNRDWNLTCLVAPCSYCTRRFR